RLQPGEAEVEALVVQQRPRQAHGGGVAPGRLALDGGSAGEAQAEQGGGLVERLPGGVVEGGAEQLGAQGVAAVEQGGGVAADDEADAGEDVAPGGQPAGVDVPLDVVGPHQRNPQRQRQHLGGADADEQGADQAGGVVDRHAADLIQPDAGLAQGAVEDGEQ